MNLNSIHNVYFIGIGGIGMSALARYFTSINKVVAGYDKTETEITKSLHKIGIEVNHTDDSKINSITKLNTSNTLIIYTPAVPKTNKQLCYFNDNGYTILKRSEVLGLITKNTFCLAVAGTHGKTTTTSILGHILKTCNVKMTAFLGGIAENYNTNLIQNGEEVSVIEADEYDRSFLTLNPDFACITSTDADHLDIYDNAKALHETFVEFTTKLKPNGKLFVKKGIPLKGMTYAVDEEADYSATNIVIKNGTYVFDIKTPNSIIKGLNFNLPGRHNLSNALVATAMAIEYGCNINHVRLGLETYKGVKRRFSYQIKTNKLVYIDDYAHHPEAITATYNAINEMYPNKNSLVVFQPHLYSRTKDFANEFAKSLALFNQILLLDIYPARELPIKNITSQWLLDKINSSNKKLVTKQNLVAEIKKSAATVIVTLGAGDIGNEVQSIKKALQNEI